MTAPHADQLIDGYLARLRAAATDVPAGTRNELIDDMRAHIVEARSRETEETDATILNILDRLGEPAVVVADARERLGVRPSARFRWGLREIAAVFLVVGVWPIGVILLWMSPAWNTRDKVIGSVLPLLGYAGVFLGAAQTQTAGSPCGQIVDQAGNVVRSSCTGAAGLPGIVNVLISIVVFGMPLIGMFYLAIRLRISRDRAAAAA